MKRFLMVLSILLIFTCVVFADNSYPSRKTVHNHFYVGCSFERAKVDLSYFVNNYDICMIDFYYFLDNDRCIRFIQYLKDGSLLEVILVFKKNKLSYIEYGIK